jgi:hypothetical protein
MINPAISRISTHAIGVENDFSSNTALFRKFNLSSETVLEPYPEGPSSSSLILYDGKGLITAQALSASVIYLFERPRINTVILEQIGGERNPICI